MRNRSGEGRNQPAWWTVAGIKLFVGEVQAEFSKIVWPDKKVTLGLTGMVVLFAILMSAYLGTIDLLLG
ncbi:MAG: preprotein translocase subunit SecE [Desulfofustis sp. PB-SRB1]|nr:preprotein translocase subunit SecE [Desulfofustis sp. PB-SRB1]